MSTRTVKLEVREQEAKSVLNKIKIERFPFKWSANPYRGCVHDCWYCYARASHEYLQLPMNRFQHIVIAKVNAPEVLRQELSRKSWHRELVAMGTITDPYQTIERQYRITRRMVQVFLEKRTPLSITTKSHHIQDDLGLLAKFAQSLPLTIFMTITSTDEALTRQLEPTTCTVKKRLETIRKLANAGITVGVLMAPVFPGMTDNEKMMESVAKAVSEAGAIYWYADLLNLREQARDYFMPYLDEIRPDLTPRYKATYAYSYPPKAHRQRIRQLQVEIATRYGLNTVERSQIVPPSKEPLATQLQFDFGT